MKRLLAWAVWLCGVAPVTAQQPADRLTLDLYWEWEDVLGDFFGPGVGPQFSPDGRQIVFTRRWVNKMSDRWDSELWVMDADGGNQRQITSLGGANFAPFFHPDGRRIVFASNHTDPRSRNFDLYLVNLDGTGLAQVTTSGEFDAFPMFSPDGRRLVFASNRHAAVPGETNIFVAEWVDKR